MICTRKIRKWYFYFLLQTSHHTIEIFWVIHPATASKTRPMLFVHWNLWKWAAFWWKFSMSHTMTLINSNNTKHLSCQCFFSRHIKHTHTHIENRILWLCVFNMYLLYGIQLHMISIEVIAKRKYSLGGDTIYKT